MSKSKLALGLAALWGLTMPVGHAGEPVTLRFSFWGSDREIQNFQEIAAAFTELHPGISVKLEGLPWGDYWTKLKTQAAGRRAPDVIRMFTGEAAGWYHRRVMLDLTQFVQRDRVPLHEHFEVGVQACTWEGKTFSLPTDIAIRIYMYDKDLFDAANVPYLDPKQPLTWEELQTIAAKLTRRKRDAVEVYGLSLGYKPIDAFVYQAGGQIVDRIVNPTQMLINRAEAKRGLDFYRGLIHDLRVSVPPNIQQDSGFGAPDFALLSGKVAIAHNGPWALSTYKEKKGLRFGLAPIAMGKTRAQVCTVNSCGVYAYSSHKEEAWEFVKFIAGPKGQEMVARLGVGIPSLREVARSDHFLKGPFAVENMEVFLDEVEHAVNNIMTPTGEFGRERDRILGDRLGLNNLSADEAAAELEKVGTRLLTPADRAISRFVRRKAPLLICAAGGALLLLVVLAAHRQAGRAKGMGKHENLAGYLFISPWIVGFILFMAFPIVAAAALSFTDWDTLSPLKWVGAQNYVDIFKVDIEPSGLWWSFTVHDEPFWQSLKVTFIYVLCSLPIQLIGGLLVAALLNMDFRGSRLFRTVLYLPYLFSGVAISFVWLWLYSPDYGLINYFLTLFHEPVKGVWPPQWLSSEGWALPAIIIMNVMWIGGNMIIFQAGLRGIPRELYESAEVDGAGSVSKFLHITIPMLTPTILFNLIMGTIGSFQVFTQAYVMTKGGPNRATLFYVLYLYNRAFQDFQMGYACALAMILFLVIFAFTYLQLRSARHWVHYEVS